VKNNTVQKEMPHQSSYPDVHPKSTALLWELKEKLIFYKVQEYERREIHLFGLLWSSKTCCISSPLQLHASAFIILGRESQGGPGQNFHIC